MAKKKSKDAESKSSDDNQAIIDEEINQAWKNASQTPLRTKSFHKDPIPSEIHTLNKTIDSNLTNTRALLGKIGKNLEDINDHLWWLAFSIQLGYILGALGFIIVFMFFLSNA